ncbi:MAG: DUF2062 domain-containing protein [Chthoniobacterales bacterium]
MRTYDWRRSWLGRYLRHIPRPKQLKGTWVHRCCGDSLLDPVLWHPGARQVAAGFSIGAFFSMIPIPMQMLPASLLAAFTRSNIPAAIVGCWVSNPITMPFFLYWQYVLGCWVLDLEAKFGFSSFSSVKAALEMLKQVPIAILCGSMFMGVFSAVVAYPLSLFVWRWLSRVVAESAQRRREKHRAKKLGK